MSRGRLDQGETPATGPIEVDVEHLADIKKYLHEMATYIDDTILPAVSRAGKDVARTYDDHTGSAFGSPKIGAVTDLSGKVNGTYRAVYQSLAGMKADFDNAGTAVEKIAKNYDDTEGRNNATAKDFTLNFGKEQPEQAPMLATGAGATPSATTPTHDQGGHQDTGGQSGNGDQSTGNDSGGYG